MAGVGEVEITLDGQRETLKSSLRAALAVNSMGGFGEVFRRLGTMDLTAYIDVVAAGLGKRSVEVEERVFATGMSALAEPLATYVGLLSNGGRPPGAETAKSGEA